MVGTHGQLKNLYSKRILKFQGVRIVVFDEADEMLKVCCKTRLSHKDLGLQAALASRPGRCAGTVITSSKSVMKDRRFAFRRWKSL